MTPCANPACSNPRLSYHRYCLTCKRAYNRRWQRAQKAAGVARVERWMKDK